MPDGIIPSHAGTTGSTDVPGNGRVRTMVAMGRAVSVVLDNQTAEADLSSRTSFIDMDIVTALAKFPEPDPVHQRAMLALEATWEMATTLDKLIAKSSDKAEKLGKRGKLIRLRDLAYAIMEALSDDGAYTKDLHRKITGSAMPIRAAE